MRGLATQNVTAALIGTFPRIASLAACLWFFLVCVWSLWRSFGFLKKSARLPKTLDNALIVTGPVLAYFLVKFGAYLIADNHGLFSGGAIFIFIDDLIFSLLIIFAAMPVYLIAVFRHRRWHHNIRALALATALISLTGALPDLAVVTMLVPLNSVIVWATGLAKKHTN